MKHVRIFLSVAGFFFYFLCHGQMKWSHMVPGRQYNLQNNNIKATDVNKEPVIIFDAVKTAKEDLTLDNFSLSGNESQVLLFGNTKKVWRYNTRGDYHVYSIKNNTFQKLGKGLEEASLMFAKFSPNGTKVAYVSNYNIYVEDLATGSIKKLTKDGSRKIINGTFDWAYEEEFQCRDGFRWSPDGTKIAFWQIKADNTKEYVMINNTDSIYPTPVPVEYPVAGEKPSQFKIGVVDINTAKVQWMNIPDDAVLRSYAPRMEWMPNGNSIIVQHLNRKQNTSTLYSCNTTTGAATPVYKEMDEAWIDILPLWDSKYEYGGWDWLDNGKAFLWASEQDGWRHLYKISTDGKQVSLLTKGDYDVMDIACVDTKHGYVYFHASPLNATQKYLYRTGLDGSGNTERVSIAGQQGTHNYDISPDGLYAQHTFTSHTVPRQSEFIELPAHTKIKGADVNKAISNAKPVNLEFLTLKSQSGINMDAWMVKPKNFDSTKKYPVIFYVYTEPWGQTVQDKYNVGFNWLYKGDMSSDGYIYVSIDNRGTPVPKGRAWRKSVYKKIGLVNIADQAAGASQILSLPYVDTSRVAVWGWSGGGSATLNLMFQYPEIYKTGIAIAAVGNQLTYDNIYQERYMGLPQENKEDFINGSPITYAKNLKGNLLYIHGTGDDNVHYNNAEMLLNQLIKYNKQFQFMPYPNRTHSISEGAGTMEHLRTLYTNYLREHCPPGGR